MTEKLVIIISRYSNTHCDKHFMVYFEDGENFGKRKHCFPLNDMLEWKFNKTFVTIFHFLL